MSYRPRWRDAAIVFAPSGKVVPPALRAIRPGGRTTPISASAAVEIMSLIIVVLQ